MENMQFFSSLTILALFMLLDNLNLYTIMFVRDQFGKYTFKENLPIGEPLRAKTVA